MVAGYGLRAHAEGAPTKQPLFYAGILEEGGKLASGPHTITLTLFATETAGGALCISETAGAPVDDGRFRVEVSADCVDAMKAQPDTWVALRFTGSDGVPHELPQRSKVGAVPYSLEAQHAVNATNGVPAGAIMMFAGACPKGWSEYTALRGRFPRGEPAGAANSLNTGGSDDEQVIAHSHTASGSTNAAGAHAHSVSGSTSQDGSHIHLETVAQGGGNGCGVTYACDRIMTNTPNTGPNTAPAGDHAHSVSGSTDAAGGHSHDLSIAVASTGVAGAGKNVPSFAEVIFCRKD